jgi:hypothetical protein
MQSSQGILTAFLRRPLPRLGCGEDDVEAGFDMGVGGGGAMSVFFSLKEVRMRSVKDAVEVWLGVNNGGMELSMNLTATSSATPTSATDEAYGPGKHINAPEHCHLESYCADYISDRLW